MENSLIKFFAIVRKSGECYLSISFDEELDETLIGGLITAIYSFGTTSLNQKLSKMSVESDEVSIRSFTYDYDQNKTLMSVAMISKELEDNQFKMFSEKVLKDFTSEFNGILENWDGEVSRFDPFKEKLKEKIIEQFKSESNNFENKLDGIFNQIIDGDLSGLDNL